MPMKNMQISKEEAQKYATPTAINGSDPDQPKYPYGLQITLDDDSLKKLGVTDLPDVGEVLNIKAIVQVCSTSEYESQGDGQRKCLGLQITDIDLGKMKKEVNADDVYNKK